MGFNGGKYTKAIKRSFFNDVNSFWIRTQIISLSEKGSTLNMSNRGFYKNCDANRWFPSICVCVCVCVCVSAHPYGRHNSQEGLYLKI